MPAKFVLLDHFFATARERYQIKLNREAGKPWPWTTDTHFQNWRFCQVHREDDKTTVWFRETIRKGILERFPSSGNYKLLKLLESTLIFRWFNRIETGEAIKDLLIYDWDTQEARSRLTGVSPVVTGAYIIKAGDGVSKLEGILACIDEARPQLPRMLADWMVEPPEHRSLRVAWESIRELHFMGGFMAYEAVSDLRWTPILDQAQDIMTWANAGPGCARGLGWVVYNDSDVFSCSVGHQRKMLEYMQELLEHSKNPNYWPAEWKQWEMREVEHWNCEFDKYMRAYGGSRLKRRFQV